MLPCNSEGIPCATAYQDPSVTGAEKSQRSEFDDHVHVLTDSGVPKHSHRHSSEYTQDYEAEKCRSECCIPDRKHSNQPTSSKVLV